MKQGLKKLTICTLLGASIIISPSAINAESSLDDMINFKQEYSQTLISKEVDLSIKKAKTFIINEQYDLASQELRRAKKINILNPYVHAMEGYLFYMAGDDDNAFKNFEESQRFAKDVPELLARLGFEDLVINKRHDWASAYFNSLSELFPNNAEINLYQGFNFLQMGKYPEAIACLKNSVKIKPIDFASFGLYKAYEGLGNKELSKFYFEEYQKKKKIKPFFD